MIFPEDIKQNEAIAEKELPLATDWAVDFDAGTLKTVGGRPYYVYGRDAVAVWIYKALRTAANVYGAYGNAFGAMSLLEADSDVETLVRECLMKSPYITDVEDIETQQLGSVLYVELTVRTIYGMVKSEVDIENGRI